MKIYQSKAGLKFSISATHRPHNGDIVFFTPNEVTFLKSKFLSPEEFEWLWKARLEDFRCPVIVESEKEVSEQHRLALEYGNKIISQLKGGRDV